MFNNMNIMYTTGMAWQLLRAPFSIPPSFLPSSPHRSSPTGRTSGPRPDLPSAPLLPCLHPLLLSSLLLFLHARIHSDTELGIQVIHCWIFYLSLRSLQTDYAHWWFSQKTVIRVSSIFEEGFHHLALKISVSVHSTCHSLKDPLTTVNRLDTLQRKPQPDKVT